jgi:hypothetical protein
MPTDNVQELSIDLIHQAVAAGEFPRALILWNDYVARFAVALNQGDVTLRQWRETGEFVAWARLAALSARAYAQDQLQSIHVTAQYECPDPLARPHLVQTSV